MVCEDYFGCLKFIFLSVLPLLGILLYGPVLWILVEGRRGVFKHGFYVMCVSLAFSDIAGSLWKGIGGYVVTPVVASGDYSSLACRFLGSIGRLFWYISEFHHFLIACSRLAAICTKHGQDWFSGRRLQLWLFLCWFAAIALDVPVLTDVAPYVYNPVVNDFTYNYSVPSALLFQQALDFGIQPSICMLQLILYLAAFVQLRKSREKVARDGLINATERRRRSKMELTMLFQALLSFLPLAANVTCFHLLVFVPSMPSQLKQVAGSANTFFSFFVFMGSPLVYLAFNPILRANFAGKLRSLFVRAGIWKPAPDSVKSVRVSTLAAQGTSSLGSARS